MNKKFSYLLPLICIVIILDLLPVFHAVFIAKVPRSEMFLTLSQGYYGGGDGGFYTARIREIIDGYPFFGNHYLFEHRQELSRSAFAADWLAAIPMFFCLSLNATLIFNAFFWSIIFVLLAYFLCRKLGLPSWISAIATLLTFRQSYFLIVRSPVSMQTIFPFLLLFYLAYLNWLSKPNSRKAMAVLAVSIAAPFYIYAFLWQMVAVTSLIALIFLLAQKEMQLAKRFFGVGAVSLILALPMFWYMFQQISSPFYEDMIQRFGIVNTRLPTVLAFSSGRWVVIALFLWALSYRWFKDLRGDYQYKLPFSFFSITGSALLFANFSNILTGKDMELPIHIERFIAIWAPLSLAAYLYFVFKHKIFITQSVFWHKAVAVILLAGSIGSLFYYWSYWPNFRFGKVSESLIAIQGSAQWLEKNEKEQVVILTGPLDITSSEIPVFTRHYVLFSAVAIYDLVSSKEVEERYLIASYFFHPLTLQKIEEDFVIYAGLGNAVHQYKTYNRKVKLCRLFQLSRFGVSCGELHTALSFRGKEYFENLYQKYTDDISPQILEKIREYQVKYILFDKQEEDIREYFEGRISSLGVDFRPVYEDERYILYGI